MKKTYHNGEQFYNSLYIKFNGFIAISLLPMAWLLLEKQSHQLKPVEMELHFHWSLIAALLFACGALSYYSLLRFKKSIIIASEKKSLRKKLDTYFQISIKKYIEFLLIGLICVAGMWITVNTLFIIGYIISLIFLSLGRPTLKAFIEDLKLSKEDQTILLEKKTIE